MVGVLASPFVLVTKSSQQGAQTQIFLSASSSINKKDSGKYFDNSRVIEPNAEGKNIDVAKRLWLESEKLTGVKYA